MHVRRSPNYFGPEQVLRYRRQVVPLRSGRPSAETGEAEPAQRPRRTGAARRLRKHQLRRRSEDPGRTCAVIGRGTLAPGSRCYARFAQM